MVASQAPEPPAPSGIPFLDDLIRGGPYAVIGILMIVIKVQYSEFKEERKARLADRDKCEHEKQGLNDKVLAVSEKTTTAVLENTQVQRQLIEAIEHVQGE